jgi:hypothetical protein
MYELEGGVTAAYFVVRAIAEDGGGETESRKICDRMCVVGIM